MSRIFNFSAGPAALPEAVLKDVQAEDGIRDPLWSRGLGDVYKRQIVYLVLIKKQPNWLLFYFLNQCWLFVVGKLLNFLNKAYGI